MIFSRRLTIPGIVTCAALAIAVGFVVRSATFAQSMPSAASVVKPQTYVSVDPVARGESFEAAVVVEIAKGFHMNSHKPSEDYMIPTVITPDPPAGIKVVDTVYPAGQLKNFSFSPKKPLNVYTDTVTLKLKLTADEKAPLGTMSIPTTLRYQACNDTTCLPPVKVPVVVRINVAASGAASHRQHPEIFKN
jgi:thiol:disulfide interchange protein DsbD